MRQAGDARRDLLLDAAAEMVAAGDADEVSMESVALRAGVSRALVYKHFANRQALLHALYERESSHLHGSMRAEVRPSPERAAMLADTWLAMTIAGLRSLATPARA